jgi:hypothetical protein
VVDVGNDADCRASDDLIRRPEVPNQAFIRGSNLPVDGHECRSLTLLEDLELGDVGAGRSGVAVARHQLGNVALDGCLIREVDRLPAADGDERGVIEVRDPCGIAGHVAPGVLLEDGCEIHVDPPVGAVTAAG